MSINIMRSLVIPAALTCCLSAPCVGAISEAQCDDLKMAHEQFMASSFQTTREFRLTVNGKLKQRETAELRYSTGTLETHIVDAESFSKLWTYEHEGRDFSLEMAFECTRVEMIGDRLLELSSEDGIESIRFALVGNAKKMIPVSWQSNDTARMLFKKMSITARASYVEFQWL